MLAVATDGLAKELLTEIGHRHLGFQSLPEVNKVNDLRDNCESSRTPTYFPMQNRIMGWKARGCSGSASQGLMCTCMCTRKDLSVSSS